MGSASSSSRFEPKSDRKFDVFISFRGEDTRHNFASHLHAALNRSFFAAFRDDKNIMKGEEIGPSLIKAIKDSSVSLIVFSQNYASSKWCLDELAHIMKYREEEGQFVIPIFYKVEPRDVRGQKGDYGKAFEKHEKDFQDDPERVKRWRYALSEAGNLSGHQINTYTDENNLIEQIIANVKKQLEYKSQNAFEDLFGIDEMIRPIEELLQKSNKVGIWGMGGAGKTTMAEVVFANLSKEYDTSFFLKNVKEKTEKDGLDRVCTSLISGLLGQDMQGNPYLYRMLSNKKALVVLDDVDSYMQLEALHDKICDHLKKGSKVIITTRDQQWLLARGFEIHEAKGLNYDNSRQLFIYHAFRSGHPDNGYEELIEGFVHYTKHNPLALKVLGSLVCTIPQNAWADLLRKLRAGNPNQEIQNVLRLSYDGLDDIEKKAFLDIACFFKGRNKEFVEELLESFEFYPASSMQTLINRALISVTTNEMVEMHDLIQRMGHQIVREENLNEPGKRSRLWIPNETIEVLKNREGKNVEGILLDFSMIKQLELTSGTFKKMKNLRFLELYTRFYAEGNINFLTSDLEFISSKIRYFRWDRYPGKSLPPNFCAEFLLELNLAQSQVETLWEGVQELTNLRRLNLKSCKKLRELPDFSKACRLQIINLSDCNSLREVPKSLLCLHSLISLDVSHCYSLELKVLSVSSDKLKYLDLSSTEIEELRLCSNLSELTISPILKLKNHPKEVLSCLTSLESLKISKLILMREDLEGLGDELFDHLHSLQSLCLTNLIFLMELPDNINQLSCLKELHLDNCPLLTKLPDNMRHLPNLYFLSLHLCSRLQSLPELPPSLTALVAFHCESLESASILSSLENCNDKVLSFKNCDKLDVGSLEEQAMRILQNAIQEKQEVSISYPAKMVPKWFGDDRSKDGLHTVQLSLSSHNLLGFVFCLVIPDSLCALVYLSITDEGGEMIYHELFLFYQEGYRVPLLHDLRIHFEFTPGNAYLISRPALSKSILEKLEDKRRNHGATTYNPILSFKFVAWGDEPIRESGVYPIYASQCSRKGKAIQLFN